MARRSILPLGIPLLLALAGCGEFGRDPADEQNRTQARAIEQQMEDFAARQRDVLQNEVRSPEDLQRYLGDSHHAASQAIDQLRGPRPSAPSESGSPAQPTVP